MVDKPGQLISPARPDRAARPMQLLAAGLLAGIVALSAVMGAAGHTDSTPLSLTAGRIAAMVALSMFMVQFALSARVCRLDRAFGLDRLYRLHGTIGAAAAALASAHPLLVYWSGIHSTSLAAATWRSYRPELTGAGALTLIWLLVVTAVWRVFLRLSYEAWRWIHRLTFVVVVAGLVHAFSIGADFQGRGWVWGVGVVGLGLYAAGFVYVKLVRPIFGRHKLAVVSAEHASHNTVNVEMRPVGRQPFRYLPGQFAFVRFRSSEVPGEEHPFTISSSPTRQETLSLTIKQSGDFTRTAERLKPQDTCRLLGPFGRFSHTLLARDGEPVVMIAGGIGITPMLSMLRYMTDSEDKRSVTLIWANRTEADMIFREELEELQGRMADLAVHHVLSRQDDWPGETGRIDRAMLRRLLTDEDLSGQAFVCGPPSMINAVRRDLRKLGFRRRKIHSERFTFP
ncbi:MAG: ferredoxin reductase family protein [Planctomycetota bacterium]|jgi:predicted ferric reductase